MVHAYVGSTPMIGFLIVDAAVLRRINYKRRKVEAGQCSIVRARLTQQHSHDGVPVLQTSSLVRLECRFDREVADDIATDNEKVTRKSVVLVFIQLPHDVPNRSGNTFDENQFLERRRRCTPLRRLYVGLNLIRVGSCMKEDLLDTRAR